MLSYLIVEHIITDAGRSWVKPRGQGNERLSAMSGLVIISVQRRNA
jgi:hypothetical protein